MEMNGWTNTNTAQSLPYPDYTTAQRNALTGIPENYCINNTDTGTVQMYINSAWYDLGQYAYPTMTTTQRNALGAVNNNFMINNSTTGTVQMYLSGTWYNLSFTEESTMIAYAAAL